MTVRFTTNPDPHIPAITPELVFLSVSENTQIGDTVYNLTCSNSTLDLSHTMNVEFYLEDTIGLFLISGGKVSILIILTSERYDDTYNCLWKI